MAAIRLTGLTWDHPRGYRGLERATARYRAIQPDVEVVWDRQPLEGFESHPIAGLAARYDLLVLDHPALGDAAAAACLVPLEHHGEVLGLDELRSDAVGPGLSLYEYGGHLWALPLDAACQAAVYRPDLLARAGPPPPHTLADARDLARGERICAALRGVHGFLIFMALCAHLGSPPFGNPEAPLDPEIARRALVLLHEMAALCVPESLDWNAIACLDAMSERDDLVYCPYIFAYASYSRTGADRPLTFTNLPGVDEPRSAGSIVGGTGLAVTQRCAHPEEALQLAAYLMAPSVQREMAFALGQPGRLSAWRDPRLNEAFGGFYLGTLETVEQAHVRPRYPGYFAFQYAAGQIVEQALRERRPVAETLDALVRRFRQDPGSRP